MITAQAILILAVLASPPAAKQTASDIIAETLTTGLKVSIVDDQGQRIDGRVEAVGRDNVRVSARGIVTDIPIDRIVRVERPDGLKNGALIGLGLGLGSGLIGTVVDARARGRVATDMLVNTIGNGIIWAALGTAIDAMVDNRRTLYRRDGGLETHVSPMVARGVRAVALSFTW